MIHIRTYILSFILIFSFNQLDAVTFQFSAGTINSGSLKTSMENNISALLTEINRAGKSGSALNLSGIRMEDGAKTRLNALWNEAAHFVCDKQTNISKCLNDFQGYQVRAIPITMKPVDSSYDQSLNRELTISLNKRGVITGVRPAWETQEDIAQILHTTGLGGVEETRMRRELLKWVEDFRCYYNERNLKALDQIYSEDALIITGSVINQRSNSGDKAVTYEQKVHYTVQDKTQYLNKLKRMFASKNRIDVQFDHISVMKHPAKQNIYGVTLHQKWRNGAYYDEGWLFLLWDFNIPEQPQIHVRTWQPEQVVAEDGVFGIDDFFIP